MPRRSRVAPLAKVFVCGVLVALGLAPQGAAMAQPTALEHFDERQSLEVEDFCGDLDVLITHEAHGVFQVTRHGDGLFYFLENVRFRETYTNLANGLTATEFGALHNKDVTIQDHGDGTLTIHAQGTGVITLRGPDHRIFVLNAAAISFELLVSDAGTPDDPFDDFALSDEVIVKKVGRDDTVGRDFCADIHQLIG